MLDVFFSNQVQLQDKKTFLQDTYGIPMNENIGEELNKMCDISDAIMEKGEVRGLDLMGKLMNILLEKNLYEEAKAATKDSSLRDRLLQEYELVPKKKVEAPVNTIG